MQKLLIKGKKDLSGSISISGSKNATLPILAASILAKVARDFEMNYLHNKYELYNFRKNNGYGTPQHIKAIECYGKTIYHRESFLK